jgi:DNA-directed RNA polymerase specialized sigma24 family protein
VHPESAKGASRRRAKQVKAASKNGNANGLHLKLNGANGVSLNGVNGHNGRNGKAASNGEESKLRRVASGEHSRAAANNPAFADRRLIDRALAGEPAAWEALYHQCHRPLVTAIRAMLRGRALDANLVDELAARVWYAVVREQGELLTRFDPARGCRLTTFLATIAKDEAGRLFRSERRRRRREAASCDTPTLADSNASQAGHTSVTMAEFEATLTPSERKFYDEIVARPLVVYPQPADVGSNGSTAARSQANLWQLSHRVRRKLERFLDG